MSVIQKLLWIGVALAGIIGGLVVTGGLLMAESAPQECSICAIGLCIAIIPYVVARAVSLYGKP
jgi:hypothetical protein